MPPTASNTSDTATFLASIRILPKNVELRPKERLFSQGDPADSVFYLQRGRAKFTVVSNVGKEATSTLLGPRDFVGEEALAAVPGLREVFAGA